jgi:hypothetical protein
VMSERTFTLAVGVTASEYALMQDIARLRGKSLSEVAREAMRLAPESEATPPRPSRRVHVVRDARRPARRLA